MSNEETREFIGCLLIPDGPISIDYNNINFIHDDFDIDIKSRFLSGVQTETIDIYTDTAIEDKLKKLIFAVVRYIETNRIPGELILYFQKIQLRWDVKFTCSIYRK